MSELPTARLDALVDLSGEKVFGKKSPDLPYIGLEQMASGSPELLGTLPSSASTSANGVFRAGDVLFGKLRPNLRKSVRAPFAGYCSTDILVLRARSSTSDRFAAHLLQSEPVFSKAVSESFGTKMPRTSWDAIRDLTTFAPPLPEQQRIAEILDTLDEAIRKTEQVIAKLQQVKQGLLHDLLTRGIDEHGELRDPDRHPEQFRSTSLGFLPAAWSLEQIGAVAAVVRGSTPRPAKDPKYFDGSYVPWITVGELSRDDWPWLDRTETGLTELGSRFSRRLEAGLVVISNSGFGCGVPKILEIAGCANDGIAAFLHLRSDITPVYLYYYLYSRIEFLRTRVARGNDQPNLNTDLLRSVEIPVPSVSEQHAICERLLSTASQVQERRFEVVKLRQLKSALMHDLLSGIVRTTR